MVPIDSDINKHLALIRRGAVEIYSEAELRRKLERSVAKNQPLIVKAGFDPTAPDLHLGHTVLLRKLRQFQDLGHDVYFLIGDFTGRIGDPSGRSDVRKQLAPEDVETNARTYKAQVSKVLDLKRLKIVFNGSWFDKMSGLEFSRLLARYSATRLLERDDFAKRRAAQKPIYLSEFIYPVLQGYDSVMLKADIEIGGTDQIFNLLVGRDLQRDFGQEEQVVLTMPLLEGTDGVQKMSKSYNNYIGINEPAPDIFGKIMSLSDEMMLKYYELLTQEDLGRVRQMHPKEAKERLGALIVADYYGPEAGERCRAEFERVFAQKELPAKMPEYSCEPGEGILGVMVKGGLTRSGNEARRLIQQGAVSFNDCKIHDEAYPVRESGILKAGSRRFLRIICLPR
jgi:tyrosyl-tRNA synthetase